MWRADPEALTSAREYRSFLAEVNASGGKPRPYIFVVTCLRPNHSRAICATHVNSTPTYYRTQEYIL